MVDFMTKALTSAQTQHRGSCTSGERALGRMLLDRWSSFGHRVREEPFACAPSAFLGFLPLLALLYLLALFLNAASLHFPALFVESAGLCLVVAEILLYWRAADPVFPQTSGVNVVAVVRPSQAPKQRVVVSAHQDAAFEFNLWWLFRTAGIPAMILSVGCLLIPLFCTLFSINNNNNNNNLFEDPTILLEKPPLSHTFQSIFPPEDPLWRSQEELLLIVSLLCWPFAALNLMFHSDFVVPGAMDNLAGVGVLVGLSSLLSSPKNALSHTEIVLLATSSEECGLRGAKAFVEAHRDEYSRGIPTRGVFVDGIYDERHLTVVSRELTTGAKHDPALVQMALDAAKDWGYRCATAVIPFGASDASAFSVGGIPAVAILCQDTTSLVHNYHTRDDVQALVRPESLTATLKVVYAMIAKLDQEVASTS